MSTPKVGVFVLETLTTGMYIDPLDSIREFVQNSTDSIRIAEKNGILLRGQGRIEIVIDPDRRILSIRDNGIGIPKANTFETLVNIGMSKKDIKETTGFRGIGRLAAIAYCDKLYFRTSAPGESVVSTITIDCTELRNNISPYNKQNEELSVVVARCSRLSEERGVSKDHFFEVILEGISEQANDFLDWQKLEHYLSQVAPVSFDAQRFVYAPLIQKWLEDNKITLETVTIVLRSKGVEREVFKPYKTHYKTKADKYDVQVRGIKIYPEKVTEKTQFWCWYADTELLGMIDDEKVAGFRLRKNNFSLGGAARIDELFEAVAPSNNRFNKFYIGEIHIISDNVVPNARRDGFEDVGAWPDIKQSLLEFVRERCSEVRKASQERNRPIQKTLKAAHKVIEDVQDRLEKGFATSSEKETVLGKVIREEERLQEAIKVRENNIDNEKVKHEIQELSGTLQQLEQLKNEVENKNNYIAGSLNPSLNRKQRQIIKIVLEVLQETLETKEFKKARDAILAKFQMKKEE